MKQNLGWASVYNVLAIPIAAGVLFPSTGIELRPEWSALLMSASSIIVAVNAVLLKRVERELPVGAAGDRGSPPPPVLIRPTAAVAAAGARSSVD
jgi:Cu2+-exporting ATPase